MTDDIADCRLVEIAAAIRAGEVSSIACTRACLDRIERLQPSTNAFIRIDAEEALAAATRADEAVTRGGELGPLHGVPLAHKRSALSRRPGVHRRVENSARPGRSRHRDRGGAPGPRRRG